MIKFTIYDKTQDQVDLLDRICRWIKMLMYKTGQIPFGKDSGEPIIKHLSGVYFFVKKISTPESW